MDKPTTAEMRAAVEGQINTRLRQIQIEQEFRRGHEADPLNVLGPVAVLNSIEREDRLERELTVWRAILADYAEPALPEGWEIVRDGRGGVGLRDRHMTLIASLHHAASASGPLSWISWTSQAPTPAACAFLLAAADAIAQAIEEEGGGDD